MDLGRACKSTKSCRRIIKKWCLDRFEIEDVRATYQRALEDKGFSESISTRGKLHVLQKHYKDLGRMSEDREWREQVKTKVSTCMCTK